MSAEADRTARLLDALYPDELENGALGAEEIERLRAAIAADPEAQAQLAAWSAVRAAAARLPEREPDPQVHYDILRAARSAPHLEKKVGFFERLWAWSLNPAVAAVGLLIVAGSLFAVYSGRQDTSTDRFAPKASSPATTSASATPDGQTAADLTADQAAAGSAAAGQAEGSAQTSSKKDGPELPPTKTARNDAEKPAPDLAQRAGSATIGGDARPESARAAEAAPVVAAEPPALPRPSAAPAAPPTDVFAEEEAAPDRPTATAAPSAAPAPEPIEGALEAAELKLEPAPAEPALQEPAPAAPEMPAPPPPEMPAPAAPQGPSRKKMSGLMERDEPEPVPAPPAMARKSAPPAPTRAPAPDPAEAQRSAVPIGKASEAEDVGALDPFPAANGPAQPSAGSGRGASGTGGLGQSAPGDQVGDLDAAASAKGGAPGGAPALAEADDALQPARETRAAAQGDSSRARRPAATANTATADKATADAATADTATTDTAAAPAMPSLAEQAQAFEIIIAAGGPAALGAAFEAAKIYERLGNLARARTLYAQVAAAPGPNAEAARARLKALDAARD